MEKAPETQQPPQTEQKTQQEIELNPEAAAWFKEYPLVEDAIALNRDKKQEFIRKYYAQDDELDEQIEKMLDEAEKVVEEEIEAGRNVHPFSQNLVLGLINVSKVKVLDELIEDVDRLYKERRKLVKGKEITDVGVAKVTQINCSKLAMMVQSKVVKQLEEEVKSRDLPLNQFMNLAVSFLIGDLGIFVEIEKFYNLKKVEENKDKPCDLEKLKTYIQESIKISDLILNDKINQGSLFLFPHILSDKLFNETGYESEEIVYYIRQLNEEGTLPDETLDLIVREAYHVEKSKEKCFKTFDNQMKQMEQQYQQMEAAARKFAAQQKSNPNAPKGSLDQDKAMMKMMQMGLPMPGMGGPGGPAPPGMGMPAPGMFPPGMGMPPPGMMPPGMFPPNAAPPRQAP
jgi:large-conductance mechanosensitive channel